MRPYTVKADSTDCNLDVLNLGETCYSTKIKIMVDMMMELKDLVVDVLVDQLMVKEHQCIHTAEIIKDLGADEFDVSELICVFEVEFECEFSDDLCYNEHITVGDIITYIEEY